MTPDAGATPPPRPAPGSTAVHTAREHSAQQPWEPGPRSWRPFLQRFYGLIPNQVPDLVNLVDKPLGAVDLRIGLVEAGVDDGLDAPGPCGHHRDPLREVDGFVHVVGDEDHGFARLLPDGKQLPLHQAAGLRIERAERLIHQQDARVEGERSGDGDALLHAARKLRRIALLKPRQADEIDEGLRPRLTLVAGQRLALEPVEHVLAHRLPWEQCKVLEHDAAIRPGPCDRFTVDQDLSSPDRQKSAHQVKQSRFAATGRTQQGEEFALLHLERYVFQRQYLPADRRT